MTSPLAVSMVSSPLSPAEKSRMSRDRSATISWEGAGESVGSAAGVEQAAREKVIPAAKSKDVMRFFIVIML